MQNDKRVLPKAKRCAGPLKLGQSLTFNLRYLAFFSNSDQRRQYLDGESGSFCKLV